MADTKTVRLVHLDGVPHIQLMELKYDKSAKDKVWKRKKGPGTFRTKMTNVATQRGDEWGNLAVGPDLKPFVVLDNGQTRSIHSRYSNLNFV